MCTPLYIHDISIGSSITGRSDLEMPSTGGGPRRSAGRRQQYTNLVMKTILKGDLMKSGEYETNGPNKLGDENHPKVPFLSSVVLFKFGAGDLFFCGAEVSSSYPRTSWSQG